MKIKEFKPNPNLPKEKQKEIERILKENEKSKPNINKKKLTKVDKAVIKMWESRQKYIAEGGKMYTPEEIEKIVKGIPL